MLNQTAFQVRRFVSVPNVALRQVVDHTKQLREHFLRFRFLFQTAEVTDSRTRRFLVIAVVQALFDVLTNALLR